MSTRIAPSSRPGERIHWTLWPAGEWPTTCEACKATPAKKIPTEDGYVWLCEDCSCPSARDTADPYDLHDG